MKSFRKIRKLYKLLSPNFINLLRSKYIRLTFGKTWIHWIYPSYWHYLFFGFKNQGVATNSYYTAKPNPDAGIGHQLANWNAGLYHARSFGLRFAHSPLSNERWEQLLGLGSGYPSALDLQSEPGLKARRVPLFLDENSNEFELCKKIIRSYGSRKMLFKAESNQPYKEQYGVREEIQNRFFSAVSRKNDVIEFCPDVLNVAAHVRRTVIIDGRVILESEEVKKKRFLDEKYYLNIFSKIIPYLRSHAPVKIYVFSTEFPEELSHYKDVEIIFCDKWDEYKSFLHLIHADVLITSKSGFSYNAALFNRNFKISPSPFWHGYPTDDPSWLLADNEGNLLSDIANLASAKNLLSNPARFEAS